MENTNRKTNWIFLSTGMLACLLVRLVPFRAPNVEPILATQMPFAKRYGGLVGFIFGVVSIVSYDLITGTFGVWTLVTASAYGLLGFFSAQFFQNKKASRKNFVLFAIMGTIFYDVFTGLTVGPLIFHQSFMVALAGQIPFTGLHLLGNISFAFLISPEIHSFLLRHQRLRNKNFEFALSTKPITN